MNIVVVELPAKAKTINKYLGSGYEVLASFGHVRDLPAKNGSVDPDADFRMIWEVDAKAQKRLNDIAKAVKGADKLILATDPDREGEAISWHVLEVLKQKKALKDQKIERVVFNAITKQAVTEAMKQSAPDRRRAGRRLSRPPRARLSGRLHALAGAVAQAARRALGRPRAVGRAAACLRPRARDREIRRARILVAGRDARDAAQRDLRGAPRRRRRPEDPAARHRLGRRGRAVQARPRKRAVFSVASVEAKPGKRNPPPPFTTSTMQQEASRKLGFAPAHTMRVAQRLYEGIDIGGETVGLITYMRTDGVYIDAAKRSPRCAARSRRLTARNTCRSARAPTRPSRRTRRKRTKPCARPTSPRRPRDVAKFLDPDQARLYELIWLRAMASQMESAELERTTVDIPAKVGARMLDLRATGTVDQVRRLPHALSGRRGRRRRTTMKSRSACRAMSDGEALAKRAIAATQHFTEPPPRYLGSLARQAHGRARHRPALDLRLDPAGAQGPQLCAAGKEAPVSPRTRAALSSAFLENFFARYVEYDFTAGLEEHLDRIANSEVDWREVLRDFWRDFIGAVDEHQGHARRAKCSTCSTRCSARISSRRARTAPIRASARPAATAACRSSSASSAPSSAARTIRSASSPASWRPTARRVADKVLARIPNTGLDVALKTGRFGTYLQLGEAQQGRKAEARRHPERLVARRHHARDARSSCSRCRAKSASTRGWRADHGRHRPVRPLRAARQDLREPRDRRRCAHHRPQSRGHADRRETREPRQGPALWRRPGPFARRTSAARRADPGEEGPLRALRRPTTASTPRIPDNIVRTRSRSTTRLA